ncbi:MAG: xanthine dehydrogenase family protein molybdopterin-binding subunit [Pseudomonadota bacterium]
MTIQASRRAVLAGTAATAGALYVGFGRAGEAAASAASELVPNPFVKVGADGRVIVIAKHFEMGQGTSTGLATLVAEELDADWDAVDVAFAPANTPVYKNLAFGAQGTGGSTAIANSYEQYRTAGAMARDLLVRAAAEMWSVPTREIKVADGQITHPSGKSAGFGELVGEAAKLSPLEKPKLKSEAEFKLIGSKTTRRKDSAAKTDGTAMFAIDVKRPGMLYAVIARPPVFGGTVKSFDDTATRAIRGVEDVKQTPRGVVVYAKNTWSAIKGRAALKIEWDESKAETRSSDEILAEHKASLDQPGLVAKDAGDAAAALKSAAKTIAVDFEFPFLAHAPMEPVNCVIAFKDGKAELWDGCQFPSMTQPTVAGILGIKPENVTINTVYAGGSFGRRAVPYADYHAEAAFAVKAIDGRAPVKLIWTREDDLHGGCYRPAYAHRIEAGIDADGNPTAWVHKLAGKSILVGTIFEKMLVKDGVDATSVEGAFNLPYAIENTRVDIRNSKTQVPVLWWRAVGHTHTAYSTEIAIDMLAEQAGVDPVAFRRKLLANHPRHLGVLELAAAKSDWGRPLGEGRGRGIAVHESFASFVAQVVEVSVRDGDIKIDRVVCAVDCGRVVNPDIVAAQMEGGVGFGLGAVMRNKITMTDGRVDQNNFPDYEPLRIDDMPTVETHIVPSTAAPTGVGEPGVPPAAPALANAIFAATGRRILKLPMTDEGISFA